MRIKNVTGALVAAGAVALLAACGGSNGSSTASSTGAAAPASSTPATAAANGTCGTVPFTPPKDPEGAFAALPKATQQGYNGFSEALLKSKWAAWKPKKDKLTVAISWNQPINDFAAITFSTLKADLKKDPHVGKIIALAGPSPADVPGQIQQYQSLLQQKPDIIVMAHTVGAPFVKLVAAAAKQGIPTVSVLTVVPSPWAVSVEPNNYQAAAAGLADVLKQIGGKGNVLLVHGIPAISVDKEAFDAFNAVLKQCPDVKVAGTVTGGFAPAQAKSAVLKFLATHPQKIDAVANAGGMATGIIGAFQQAGRPVASVNDNAALKGSLGYWRQNKGKYKGAGTGGSAVETGHLFSAVTERMIAGDGVKVSAVTAPQPVITEANLDQWSDPSWNLSTPGTAPGPPGSLHIDALLAPLFNSSGK